MTVVVTGGLGYIGAHVARLLTERGDQVLIVDDLSTGLPARAGSTPVLELDLAAPEAAEILADAMVRHRAVATIHLAAHKSVPESVADPLRYYRRNLAALDSVLTASVAASVPDVVFSSSAAVYGEVGPDPVTEQVAPAPVNPYGRTKLIGEWMVADAVRAHELRAISLRYFNVAGAGWPDLGDRGENNLIPQVFGAIARGERPQVFGTDYPTPDGSCVRDFVHVLDLAQAHLAALDRLSTVASAHHEVFNVGTGSGSSVLDVMRAASAITDRPLQPELLPRRAGDPATVVADPALIAARMGWRARLGLDDILRSTWEARSAD